MGYFGYRGNILTCAAQGRTANFHAAPPRNSREIRNPEAEKCFFPIPLSCPSLLFLFWGRGELEEFLPQTLEWERGKKVLSFSSPYPFCCRRARGGRGEKVADQKEQTRSVHCCSSVGSWLCVFFCERDGRRKERLNCSI